MKAPKRAPRRPKNPPKRKGRSPDPLDADGFTLKERAFVVAMIGEAEFNQRQAAIISGTPPRSAGQVGSRMMQKERIRELVASAMMDRNERMKIGPDWVLGRLIYVFDLCKSKNDVKGMMAALAKIGDHVNVGAFRKQIGLSNPNGGPVEVVDLSNMSAEELDAYERLAEKYAPDRPREGDEPDDGEEAGAPA